MTEHMNRINQVVKYVNNGLGDRSFTSGRGVEFFLTPVGSLRRESGHTGALYGTHQNVIFCVTIRTKNNIFSKA